MAERLLFIVNGKPRAGKDTTVLLMSAQFQARGWETTAFSSIDPIRKALSDIDVDTSQKTQKDRDLLAEVGFSLEKHCQFRTTRCVARMQAFFIGREKAAFFLHMREAELMRVIKEHPILRQLNVKTRVIFVSGRGQDVTSNEADGRVHETPFDVLVENDASLCELSAQIATLVRDMTEGAL